MEFEGIWATFYRDCLAELEKRVGWSETTVPLLKRYVFATKKLSDLCEAMVGAEATVKLTNNKGHTNDASNPQLRVFVILNKESLALAKELGLTPASRKHIGGVAAKKVRAMEAKMTKAA